MKTLTILLTSFINFLSYSQQEKNTIKQYTPINKTLYNKIIEMDSIFFGAYNTCDLKKQALIYADSLEFFHDKSGLETSKEKILASTDKFICGKVTREVLKKTIEVYPIKDYGAVEIGFHQFHNNQEPDIVPTPTKFIIMWQKKSEDWKISKVISLH